MPTAEKLRIILFGLDEALSSELLEVLRSKEPVVHAQPFQTAAECLDLAEEVDAHLIFCSSDPRRYVALLETIERNKPGLPVVVVSRAPEVSEWLDAIEAGAADYCAAPFESGHVEWILESALKRRSSPAPRRASG